MTPDRDEKILEIQRLELGWPSHILAALSSLDRGEGIPHKRIRQWVASWETSHERPSP
jgi:predicted transcriptional regulator